MEAYKRWVRRNKDYVHSLESLVNGLTWLLPERFSDSEIGPEAVTSILGIFTAVNEHIIDTTPTPANRGDAEHSLFPYSLCITLLKDIETLVEVVGQQFYGDDKKWNFIAATEALKVLVRLALFQSSGYQMLLHGGENPNVDKASNASNQRHGYENLANPRNLEGRALSALTRFGENARINSDPSWLRRVQQHHSATEPPNSLVERPTLSSILSEKGISGGLFVMGEVMNILRPLIYVLLIRKYRTRSWFPWFFSLGVDLVGMGILSQVTKSQHGMKDQHFRLSDPEKHELKRRKLLWALYLMRDPFFSKYTRQRLESTEKILEPVPIVGFLAGKLIELLVGAQTRYTYMSGS
ncbi:hypothetical protein LguiA_019170 [Lonicera macranthoides]